MYAAALHRLSPPTRVEGARHSWADSYSPAGWAAVSQYGRDACHPLPAATGAILPNAVEEPGPA
jgi:hypothetical protein